MVVKVSMRQDLVSMRLHGHGQKKVLQECGEAQKEGMHFPEYRCSCWRYKNRVWKVDFRVIQAIIKQKAPSFIAFKNIYVTEASLMHIGPINNVVNSYYVFLLFSPGREEYTAGCFKIKIHMHKHILLDIDAGES